MKKFILWKQQLTRADLDSPWMLSFDQEILVEGPSQEWCESLFKGVVDIHPFCKVLTINVMPFADWKADNDKWAETDLIAASEAREKIETVGFVNYPANSPTPWCASYKERVPAI